MGILETPAGWPAASPWKSQWHLAEDVVFLNHGSFGACPREVLQVQSQLRELMERNPLQFLARHYEERLDAARNVLAEFVGADPGNLAFVTNATTGVNAVARSLHFNPGDEIITTSLDYNACRNALAEAATRSGASLVVAEIPFPLESSDRVVNAILSAVTPKTKLVMVDHVTSNSAMMLPVEKIVDELLSLGIDTLVDGAHAPGMLPLDLEKLGAAYYTGNLHKWACAPKGAAFLWVRPDKQDEIQPAVISHGNNRPRLGHTAFQTRFDWPATHDPTAWLCAAESIRWLGDFLPGGWPSVYTHHHRKVIDARRLLCAHLDIAAPCPEEMIGSMATLPMPGKLASVESGEGTDPVYLSLFEKFHIEIPVVRMNGRRWFRISAHLHNSADEYRYLAESIAVLCEN